MKEENKKDPIQQLTNLQLELGYKRGELSTVAMLGLVGEAGEVLAETEFKSFSPLFGADYRDAIKSTRLIEKHKKLIRSGTSDITLSVKDQNSFDAELGDAFYYINILAFNRNLTLYDLAQMAYDKIKRKQSEGGSSEDPKK